MSSRSALAIAFLAGALGCLPGCGFKPLYGANSAAHGPAAVEQFATIEIPVLPDRTGQIMRNLLIDSLHPSGAADTYQYRLDVKITEADVSLGLQGNSTSTRGQIKISALYSLIDKKTGKNLLKETVRTSAGYNILVNQFGTELSTQSSRQEALQEIADDITLHLALYFTRDTEKK
jgi:LPS-assembly lipoprotein